jgi:hypothetical protein
MKVIGTAIEPLLLEKPDANKEPKSTSTKSEPLEIDSKVTHDDIGDSDDDLDLSSIVIHSDEPVAEIKKKRKNFAVPVFLATAALTIWAVSKFTKSEKKQERQDPPWISLGLRRIG